MSNLTEDKDLNHIYERASLWLKDEFDEETRVKVKEMMDDSNHQALIEAFYKNLEFGTGGLRGIMGVGTNRMNKYTVGMATQGLANYLISQFPRTDIKVSIAYDSRNNSRFFSEIAANVLSANNITVYLFEDIRPTPLLSFAIRHLSCHSGIVVTASHNPKEYNGYKVYWNDGAQLVNPHDDNVIKEVLKIREISSVKFNPNSSLIHSIGKNIDEAYFDKIKNLSFIPASQKQNTSFKIVYTPLHGTGQTLVPQALKEFGFSNVHCVAEQSIADGNFPTVKSPNPEEHSALELALRDARKCDADIVLATDPDADRVGVAVKHNADYILLSGNQTASLMIYYLLHKLNSSNKINDKSYIVKTIVTTELIKSIADHFKVKCFDVLTGFKYIAEIIRNNEADMKFIAGAEESYGYLVGDYVRDKDAVISCCMIAEAALFASQTFKSPFNMLLHIYKQFGFFKESLVSQEKKGIAGQEEIKEIMKQYRANPPASINNSKVIMIKDYLLLKENNLITGKTSDIHLPVSDVLQFFLDDGSKISVRPSGTEPKIKYYFGIKGILNDESEYNQLNQQLDAKLKAIISDLKIS